MPFIEWSDEFSVSIADFDDQHKTLVRTLNTLHDAVEAGKAQDALGDTIKELIDYAINHFSAEEALMGQYGFPGLEEHKKVHDLFIETVGGFKDNLDAGTTPITLEVVNFLKVWLVDHIMGTDKQYVSFLLEKGER